MIVDLVPTPNPLALIEKALASGIDPEKLGKLLDLQERWTRDRARESYNNAMRDAQADMPTVAADATNSHTRSQYAQLESVIKAVKPIYTRHGFSLSFSEAECPREGYFRVVCEVSHTGGEVRTKFVDLALDGTGAKGTQMMTAVQGKGSTLSYGRRYLTLLIFNIAVGGEDTDGNPPDGPISEQQARTLLDLVVSTARNVGRDEDELLTKCLSLWEVANIEDLPRSKHGKAVWGLDELNRRKAKNGGAK